MLGIFSDQERALPPSTEIKEQTFFVKKKWNDAFQGVYF